MRELGSPLRALAHMKMETETTACLHAAEMVRRQDKTAKRGTDEYFSAA
jgi:hypothetical protein